MNWRIVRRDRSVVRVELFEEDGRTYGRNYINIEGSKAKGYRWYSGTEVFGSEVLGGRFKDVSQDAAIQTAIRMWGLMIQEVVNEYTSARLAGTVEGRVSE